MGEPVDISTPRRRYNEGAQQVTRIPPWVPGSWVKLHHFSNHDPDAGKVRQVQAQTCIQRDAHARCVWRVILTNGRSLLASCVERRATVQEIERATNGNGATHPDR